MVNEIGLREPRLQSPKWNQVNLDRGLSWLTQTEMHKIMLMKMEMIWKKCCTNTEATKSTLLEKTPWAVTGLGQWSELTQTSQSPENISKSPRNALFYPNDLERSQPRCRGSKRNYLQQDYTQYDQGPPLSLNRERPKKALLPLCGRLATREARSSSPNPVYLVAKCSGLLKILYTSVLCVLWTFFRHHSWNVSAVRRAERFAVVA